MSSQIPKLFRAALIADAEIDSLRPGQVRGQAANKNVVFGCYRALDAASAGRHVFTDTQAFLRGPFNKGVAYHHSQGSLARQFADSFHNCDRFTKPRPTFFAIEQVFLDSFFFRFRQRGEPIVGEDRRVNGV